MGAETGAALAFATFSASDLIPLAIDSSSLKPVALFVLCASTDPLTLEALLCDGRRMSVLRSSGGEKSRCEVEDVSGDVDRRDELGGRGGNFACGAE